VLMLLLKDCPVRSDWLGVLLLLSVIFLVDALDDGVVGFFLVNRCFKRRRSTSSSSWGVVGHSCCSGGWFFGMMLVVTPVFLMLYYSSLEWRWCHSCGLDVLFLLVMMTAIVGSFK
jgi:hypothetical protein